MESNKAHTYIIKAYTYIMAVLFLGAWFVCPFLYADQAREEQMLEPANEVKELSLQEISEIALAHNLDIQMAKIDRYIERNELDISTSIFDTYLTMYASYLDSEKDISSSLLGTKTTTRKYGTGLTKKLPTGTDVTLDLFHERVHTNSAFATLNPSQEANAKVSVKQAIGENFFGLKDRMDVKLTKIDIQNFEWTSTTDIEGYLADAQKGYWKLVLAHEELMIREEMLQRAKDLLAIYQDKFQTGLAEGPDLLAAQVNVKVRESELQVGKLDVTEAGNNLLFLINVDDLSVAIEPKDHLAVDVEFRSIPETMSEAIQMRRDYKYAKNLIERNKIDILMKKNAMWPQIDLEASFARNGIDKNQSNAWSELTSEEHPELYFGITLSTSLENSKEKAQLNQAQLGKEKYLLLFKKTERLILKEINNKVSRLNTDALEAMANEEIVRLQEEKLKAEQKRLRYGRSSSDTVIRYQDDLLRAKLNHIYSLYNYRLSLIDLDLGKHSLLDQYWIGEL